MVLKYFKYLCSISFKWFFLHVTWALYFFMLIFLLYILPVILDLNLFYVTNYVYFFMFFIFFAVLNATTIIVVLFRKSIDDGSEILISTKPITRTAMIYCKILLFFLITILVSALSSIICLLTQFTNYSTSELSNNLAINMLVATLLIYFFIGGLSLICCMFFKIITTIFVITSAFVVLMIYAVITPQIMSSPTTYSRKKQSIYYTPISLVQNNNNNLFYHWGANASINNSNNYLTSTYYSTQKYNVPANEYLSDNYSDIIKKTNFELFLSTNIVYQLSFLYTQQPKNFFNTSYYFINDLLNLSDSLNIKLNFDTNSLSNKNLMYVDLNNEKYYLANNLSSVFVSMGGSNNKYESNINFLNNSGTINLDSTFDLPTINNDQILLKTYDTTIQSLKQFVNDFFIDDNFSYPSSALEIFNSYNIDNYGKNDYKSEEIKQKILNKTANDFLNFQLLVFNALKNQEKIFENLQLTNDKKILILTELFNNINYSNNYQDWVFVYSSTSDISKISSADDEQDWCAFTPPFYLINSEQMPTFNFVNLTTFLNYNSLVSGWFIFGFITFTFGIILFFKFNFY